MSSLSNKTVLDSTYSMTLKFVQYSTTRHFSLHPCPCPIYYFVKVVNGSCRWWKFVIMVSVVYEYHLLVELKASIMVWQSVLVMRHKYRICIDDLYKIL